MEFCSSNINEVLRDHFRSIAFINWKILSVDIIIWNYVVYIFTLCIFVRCAISQDCMHKVAIIETAEILRVRKCNSEKTGEKIGCEAH